MYIIEGADVKCRTPIEDIAAGPFAWCHRSKIGPEMAASADVLNLDHTCEALSTLQRSRDFVEAMVTVRSSERGEPFDVREMRRDLFNIGEEVLERILRDFEDEPNLSYTITWTVRCASGTKSGCHTIWYVPSTPIWPALSASLINAVSNRPGI